MGHGDGRIVQELLPSHSSRRRRWLYYRANLSTNWALGVNIMYRHARNNMLTLSVDYHMSKEDVKAYQHNWTQSMREHRKLISLGVAAKFKAKR
jgi:hypothetical protein